MTRQDQRKLQKLLGPLGMRKLEVCIEAYDRDNFGQAKAPDYNQLETFLTECLSIVKKLNTPVDEDIAA